METLLAPLNVTSTVIAGDWFVAIIGRVVPCGRVSGEGCDDGTEADFGLGLGLLLQWPPAYMRVN